MSSFGVCLKGKYTEENTGDSLPAELHLHHTQYKIKLADAPKVLFYFPISQTHLENACLALRFQTVVFRQSLSSLHFSDVP